MRLLDAVTALTLGEHEPNTYVSVLFYGASFYFGAHIGCAHRAHDGARLKEIYLFEEGDEPVGENRRCYYCEREWIKAKLNRVPEGASTDH